MCAGARETLHRLRREQLDRRNGRVDASAPGPAPGLASRKHGDDRRDIGLDRRHHIGRGDVVLGHHREQPGADSASAG